MDDFKSSECVRNYEIKYFTDEPFSLVHTAPPGRDEGFLTEIGWGAATPC
jgi:hypothetical protein